MKALTIKPEEGKKGRAFAATLLGYMTADRCWDGGTRNGPTRPIYLAYATSLAEAGPFTANLRAGRRAIVGDASRRGAEVIETLRSAGYAFTSQRSADGVVTTVYLPELFRVDPGMVDPSGARFAVLPDQRWATEQTSRIDLDGIERHARALDLAGPKEEPAKGPSMARLLALAPLASLFAAYLDRRVRAPLIPDTRFFVQVLVRAVNEHLASLTQAGTWVWGDMAARNSWSPSVKSEGLDALGFAEGVTFASSHQAIEEVLADEVSRFYRVTTGRAAA